MAGVTLTAALRSNLLSLQGTQRLLDSTQLKLATGKKVNSALDDPGAFFAAQSLNNRASDLTRLLDGIGQGVQTLKSADEGIKTLTSFLEQAQSVAQEALDQANGASVGASFSGNAAIDSTNGDTDDLTTNVVTAGDQFTIQVGTGPTTTFTIAAGTSLADLVAQVNTIDGLQATIVPDATTSTDRNINVRTTNGQTVTFTDVNAGTVDAVFGTNATQGVALPATAGVPADQVSLEGSYTELLSQIDTLVSDAGYRGTNLLSGSSLTVNFNEDSTSSLSITGVDFSSAGLSVSAANFSNTTNIQAALDEINSALDAVRAQSRTFGNNLSIIQARQDFTESLVNVLKEGSDKLTLADKNEEGANLLSLQTSQQLGITSLSLASQANQSVLRLFG